MNLPASQVLLIEDDPRMPEVLAGLLQDDHITLSSAGDALAGLKLAREKHFDLILLDLGLPGVNGFELLRQLKESPETETIPIIVLTAWNSTSDKLRGFELGAVDYLTKPFESAELRARLRAVLRTKHLQDELTQTNRELLAARLAAESASRAAASPTRTTLLPPAAPAPRTQFSSPITQEVLLPPPSMPRKIAMGSLPA